MGAGDDLDEALQTVVLEVNGVRFGFVSLGDSKLSPVVFAAEDHPGIAHLSEENMRKAIKAAKEEQKEYFDGVCGLTPEIQGDTET